MHHDAKRLAMQTVLTLREADMLLQVLDFEICLLVCQAAASINGSPVGLAYTIVVAIKEVRDGQANRST
jgi:hypothetical protein